MLNKKQILENSLDQIIDALNNDMPEECWKVAKSLTEKKMLELDDLKDVILNTK